MSPLALLAQLFHHVCRGTFRCATKKILDSMCLAMFSAACFALQARYMTAHVASQSPGIYPSIGIALMFLISIIGMCCP